jgi:DNA (cytosine-5)-methyltransferase 1
MITADVRYLSVCSGIEAASVAWHPLGWEPAAFCEIEAFPSAVLKERYPHVPNYGDFTRLTEPDHPIRSAGIDLLVGGTPCQAFSVAGLRRGLADPRGGLTLEFVRLAQALRPKWVVWENVPGVLSQDGGRAFGAFLGALGELGYGWAYRVLDAQYVRVDGYPHAVPQRRRRVFVVGCAGGDFARAAAVLLEPEGVRGNPPTRRATRKGAAPDAAGGFTVCGTLSDGAHHGGGLNGQDAYTGRILPVASTYAKTHKPMSNEDAEGWSPQDHSPTITYWPRDRSDAGTDVAVVQYNETPWDTQERRIHDVRRGLSPTLSSRSNGGGTVDGWFAVQPLAFDARQSGTIVYGDKSGPLDTDGHSVGVCVAPSLTAANDPSRSPQSSEVTQQVAAVHAASMSVRRLTPTECERLQGFPDGWTQIAWKGKPPSECPDGPRYRALGNSMAVNVMRWIGRRIELVEKT